jgi:ABC-2 type transport system permease protein
MTELMNVLWIEFRKVLRSKVPFFLNFGFLMIPLMLSLMMFIYRDPEFAKRIGIISAKANMMGGTADWPTFLGVASMAISMAGIFMFGLLESWVFGREFADRTLKDMLAVPVARATLVQAKLIVTFAVGLFYTLETILVCGLAGWLLKLPLGSTTILVQGFWLILLTAILVLLANVPFAYLASLGKGYLLPLGVTILVLLGANVVAVMGWGDVFPWAIPGLLSGMGEQTTSVTPISYVVIAFTALIGYLATVQYWQKADHHQ